MRLGMFGVRPTKAPLAEGYAIPIYIREKIQITVFRCDSTNQIIYIFIYSLPLLIGIQDALYKPFQVSVEVDCKIKFRQTIKEFIATDPSVTGFLICTIYAPCTGYNTYTAFIYDVHSQCTGIDIKHIRLQPVSPRRPNLASLVMKPQISKGRAKEACIPTSPVFQTVQISTSNCLEARFIRLVPE